MTTLTIDKKVTMASLWAMLCSFVGGTVYMANLNSNLLVATDTLREVKTAIEKNTLASLPQTNSPTWKPT
jgi:hypothetical protein